MKADLHRCTLSHCQSQLQFGIQTFPCANNLNKSQNKTINYQVIMCYTNTLFIGIVFSKTLPLCNFSGYETTESDY